MKYCLKCGEALRTLGKMITDFSQTITSFRYVEILVHRCENLNCDFMGLVTTNSCDNLEEAKKIREKLSQKPVEKIG